jgi:hypothetical protein
VAEPDERYYIDRRLLAEGVKVAVICPHNQLLIVLELTERLTGAAGEITPWRALTIKSDGTRGALHDCTRSMLDGTEEKPRRLMHYAGYHFNPPSPKRACRCSFVHP